MFAEERLQEILKTLKVEGKLKVKDLSTKFDVTEDCIRKDLKSLENQGQLKRTYGGAVQLRESAQVHDIFQRKDVDISTKNIIAIKAFNVIKDRETIFLDISTTNILLSKLLAKSDKKLTVVTNMLEILNILSKENNITVISPGGVLNKELDGFTGICTIDFISKYKFDRTFIGSCGIDVFDRSITTFEIDDGITKKAIIESGKKNYIVMESKKFYFDGNYKFATIDDIDCIITDEIPKAEINSVLDEFSIQLI
ncbi:MAG: DeoR/GlpR transcriptional regulator [Clostridiaceae bacterium]|nr:DeoR/GlpR transcriptional regulator [Clostridiaceae bacterium]